jgi:UDP-N-acetylmuramoyl-L-alanyl-D-glutamate--2,6-diaminopimelate ligase
MEAYFRAKAKLFDPSRCAQAIVNGDDNYGRLLASAAQVPTTVYRLADALDLRARPDGASFRFHDVEIDLALGGSFNIANALAAARAAEALGVSARVIADALAGVTVPGRYEPVRAGQDFAVIVDFAHTPDGLAQVLSAACASLDAEAADGTRGRLHVVFGCGGDRDAGKRPQMGEIAARLADRVYVTSDNPRSEDPPAIIEAVLGGIVDRGAVVVDPDRRSAIRQALRQAGPGDIVVLAGKGHESGQEIAGVVSEFDDRTVAAEEIRALLAKGTRA